MKNNYLLVCEDKSTIKEKINELVNSFSKDASISRYDLEENTLDVVLEDLDTYGLFSQKKIIIVENIFTNPKDMLFDNLIKYINNYNSDNLFLMTQNKLDSRLSIVKEMKKNKNLELLELKVDSESYVLKLLKGYKISRDDISLIAKLCKDDISRITNECNKLMLYKLDSKEIKREDITNLIVEKLGESDKLLFSLCDYIITKDKKNALLTLRELKKYNIDSYAIIGLMSSQIRLLHQIKVLDSLMYSDNDIVSTLKLKSIYQVKKIKERIYKYSYEDIFSFVKLLASIDLKLKSGKLDSNSAIEMLIINM